VVDNASTDGAAEWIEEQALAQKFDAIFCDENRYPGYACNRGFGVAPPEATFLHRADNDFIFLPRWCDEVRHRFLKENVGQVGLRTGPEEMYAPWNVGGNCIIRRTLWDLGLRYDETPWPDLPAGYSEDSFLSPEIERMGFRWVRVKRPCIMSLASGDWDDPYYQASYGARHIERPD
jgi:glycosyltransferase involved in cell wall biosynthesis